MKVTTYGQYAGVIFVAALLAFLVPAGGNTATPDIILVEAPPTVLNDLPAAEILKASLTPSLTQWGTTANYTGNGPAGLTLDVATPGSVTEWTIDGYANETTPPTIPTCTNASIHFTAYDWAFQSSGTGSGTTGHFISTPSSVPQRLTPGGDQCFLRVGATGTWHIRVCVEGKLGGPRGYYLDDANHFHFDDWDRCPEMDVQV